MWLSFADDILMVITPLYSVMVKLVGWFVHVRLKYR